MLRTKLDAARQAVRSPWGESFFKRAYEKHRNRNKQLRYFYILNAVFTNLQIMSGFTTSVFF
jgi:hypothetical protein